MPTWLEGVRKAVFAIVAIWLTVNYDLATVAQHHASKGYWVYIDPKTVAPVVAGIIYYVFGIAYVMFFNAFVDDKHLYTGRYLSLPSALPDELNIFDIKRGLISRKYTLHGSRYSLSTQRRVGSWSSDMLDMAAKKHERFGNLRYIYWGLQEEIDPLTKKPKEGDGYVNIKLYGEKLEKGSGYWIPDENNLVKYSSKYYKATFPEYRQELTRNWRWYTRWTTRFWWKKKSIVKAFAELVKAGGPHPFNR